MIKLLFVVTEDWYFVSHRLPLAAAAVKAGFQVSVATRIGAHSEKIKDAGIKLIPLELSRQGGNPLLEVTRLILLYCKESPDIIHHVALKPVIYGTIATLFCKPRLVVNAIAGLGWLFSSSGFFMPAMQRAARVILGFLLSRSFVSVIVQNTNDQRLLCKSGVPLQKIILISGAGVDTSIFTPRRQEPHSGKVSIVLASRMLWAKGVGELVEAAKLINHAGISARFILVGNPDFGNPEAIPLETLRHWNGVSGVEWWGAQEGVAGILQNADIACLPSYYGEGVPKFLIEAAASGLPIVTTDTPGCRDVVQHEKNGFLVPTKDPVSLVEALRKLILDANLRRVMGRNSRALALESFSQELVIKQTMAIYKYEANI